MELQTRRDISQTSNLRPSLPLNDKGVKVVVVAALLIFLVTVAVPLRFYARHLKRVSFNLEDWLLLASTVHHVFSTQQGAEPNTLLDSVLCIRFLRYSGCLHRRHRLSRQWVKYCAAPEGAQGTYTNPRRRNGKLQLNLALDITRPSNFVCDWAWAHQMQHLLDAHSDLLR